MAKEHELSGADRNKQTDELDVRLNGDPAGFWPSTEERPTDESDDKAAWEAHAISMGLDVNVAREWDLDRLKEWLDGSPPPQPEDANEPAVFYDNPDEVGIEGDTVQPDE